MLTRRENEWSGMNNDSFVRPSAKPELAAADEMPIDWRAVDAMRGTKRTYDAMLRKKKVGLMYAPYDDPEKRIRTKEPAKKYRVVTSISNSHEIAVWCNFMAILSSFPGLNKVWERKEEMPDAPYIDPDTELIDAPYHGLGEHIREDNSPAESLNKRKCEVLERRFFPR
jgi:hypothetical protein